MQSAARLYFRCKFNDMGENDIKLAFVRDVLYKHGKKIVADIREGIRFNQYQGTGHMEGTLNYFVDRAKNSDGTLHIETVPYLRYQDIMASHKNRKAAIEKKRERKQHNSIRDNQFTGERKGFYTKSIYQHITPIIWDLSYGFTQEVIDNFRKTFAGIANVQLLHKK